MLISHLPITALLCVVYVELVYNGLMQLWLSGT